MKNTSACAIAVLAVTLPAFVAVQRADLHGQAAGTRPSMTATLVDAEKKAAERAATVEVTTSGVQLIDPATAMERPAAGQGHLH